MTNNLPDESGDSTAPKWSPISPLQLIDVVRILKVGLIYGAMLNEFERNFVADFAEKYATYAKKLQMSPKQLNILYGIADKLHVTVNT
jgi:hypothetical protein